MYRVNKLHEDGHMSFASFHKTLEEAQNAAKRLHKLLTDFEGQDCIEIQACTVFYSIIDNDDIEHITKLQLREVSDLWAELEPWAKKNNLDSGMVIGAIDWAKWRTNRDCIMCWFIGYLAAKHNMTCAAVETALGLRH